MELNFNLIPDNERILSIFDEIRYLIIVKEGRGFWREIADRSVERCRIETYCLAIVSRCDGKLESGELDSRCNFRSFWNDSNPWLCVLES